MEKRLNVKRIKQMCSVPGCANRGSYTMARTRYFGGVNICENCLREALALIAPVAPPTSPTLKELLLDDRFKEELKKAIEDGVKDGIERAKSENVPDLLSPDTPSHSGDTFENVNTDDGEDNISDGIATDSDVENTLNNDTDGEPVQAEQPEQTNGLENQAEAKKFVCSKCGKVCASQSGLTSHEKACGNK